MKIKIGSRDSVLAVKQSQMVIDLIKEFDPTIETELITMKTTGDIILDRSLQKIGGKGLFVKELDKALADKVVDITVHSLKDMPMEESEELPLIAFLKRDDPFDALILPEGKTEIDFTKPIGSSSMRRSLFVKELYPNAVIEPVRGNVITRLNKLDSGNYGALILAAAGLKRIDLGDRISKIFSEKEMIPAAGQGIIVVQGRKGESFPFTDYINDKIAEISARAERAFVRYLDGGCSLPIGAYSTVCGDEITIKGLYFNEANSRDAKGSIKGNISDCVKLAEQLAIALKEETK